MTPPTHHLKPKTENNNIGIGIKSDFSCKKSRNQAYAKVSHEVQIDTGKTDFSVLQKNAD